MAKPNLPRIFVNIASYRDTECQWTVKDIFEKAKHKDRVFVGICWQFVKEEDEDCFLFSTRPEQCRIIEVDARDSKGACWARRQIQSLWRGEEYVLQIDSHMRFVEDWDEKMLAMLAECPSPRPLLSTYPPSYTPPDKIETNLLSVMFARHFDQHGVLKLHSYAVEDKPPPTAPIAHPFIAAGFLFGESRFASEVPYDPYLYFQGEEITMAARLWTHGWDFFSPYQVLLWHDYTKRPGRRRHWHDHEHWSKLNDRACKRVRHLLGVEPTDDPDALIELDRFGLGQSRSLADYEALTEVNFRERTVKGKTTEQLEAEEPPAEHRRRNAEVFGEVFTANKWGSSETVSGAGSTLAATLTIREKLVETFAAFSIHSLTDAGCGDLNWISQISHLLTLYFGFDVVEPLIAGTREKYGRRRGHFFSCADITMDDLPQSDAILCRDVLTHLPYYGVNFAIRQFKASGSGYLIATTHPGGSNAPIETGAWHPINLEAAPFHFPPPQALIAEGLENSVKSLGVWRIADVPG